MGKIILLRRKFLLAGAGLLAAPAIVRAGQMSLLGAGKVSGVVTPVAVDAAGINGLSGSVTSFDYTGMTVGAGLTHGALVVCVGLDHQAVTGVTLVWDSGGSNQSMTKIGSDVLTPTGSGLSQIWGLINPTAGNKTLHVAWTTTAQLDVCGLSFSNVLQTGGASSFAPFNATGSAATGSVTVTGTTNDYAVASWTDSAGGAISAVSDTSLYRNNGGVIVDFAGNYGAQTGSKSLTMTVGGSNTWAAAAVNVVAG